MSHKNSIAGSSKNPLECRVFQWHTELDLWSAWVALLEIELVSLPWDTVLTQNTQRVTHNTSPLGLSLTHVVHRLSLASPWPVTEGKEQRLFRKHYVIWNPSKIFEFLLIATLPTFLKFDMLDLCHWNHGPGPEMVHKLGFRYVPTLQILRRYNKGPTVTMSFSYFGMRVKLVHKRCNSKTGMCHLIHTPAEMNTIMCWIITKNVKHRMFSLCLLQKLNNRCDFVPLSCVYLGYRGWLESNAPQPLKDELSGAAKMDEELSLIAHEHKDCSGTDHIDIMLQQQPYTISLF